MTALMWASKLGMSPILEFLMSQGADSVLVNSVGDNALRKKTGLALVPETLRFMIDLACQEGHHDIVEKVDKYCYSKYIFEP